MDDLQAFQIRMDFNLLLVLKPNLKLVNIEMDYGQQF